MIKLLPVLDAVRVFDNSADAPPGEGRKPVPVLVLEMKGRKITAPADLSHAPGWAKPIVAAAMRLHRG